jgi:hypothetical protein
MTVNAETGEYTGPLTVARIEEAQARLATKIKAQRILIDVEQRQLDRLEWSVRLLEEGRQMLLDKQDG